MLSKNKIIYLKKRLKNNPFNYFYKINTLNFFNKCFFMCELNKFLLNNLFFCKYYLKVVKSSKKYSIIPNITILKQQQQQIYTINFFKKRFGFLKLFDLFKNNPNYVYSLDRFFFFVKIMLITIAKILLVASCMFPIGACAIAAGILFSGYNLAVSRNPEEKDLLFGHTLMWFAFIETFMFMSFLVAVVGAFAF